MRQTKHPYYQFLAHFCCRQSYIHFSGSLHVASRDHLDATAVILCSILLRAPQCSASVHTNEQIGPGYWIEKRSWDSQKRLVFSNFAEETSLGLALKPSFPGYGSNGIWCFLDAAEPLVRPSVVIADEEDYEKGRLQITDDQTALVSHRRKAFNRLSNWLFFDNYTVCHAENEIHRNAYMFSRSTALTTYRRLPCHKVTSSYS